MIFKQSFQKLVALSVALSLGIVSLPLIATSLRAQSTQNSFDQTTYLNTEFKPPRRGSPPETVGGGSRGCSYLDAGKHKTTALIPPSQHLALTVKGNPTFFWYVPRSAAKALEFTLMDQNDQEVFYKVSLPIPQESRIVSLTLPSNSEKPLLEVGKLYHWYLAMVCDPQDRTGDIAMDGWIERVDSSKTFVKSDLTLSDALAMASQPEEKFSLYAKAGVWHDAIATLATLRRSQPDNAAVEQGWEGLLKSVGLERFSKVKLYSDMDNQTVSSKH